MENIKNMFNINDISGQNGECCAYANQFLPYAHKKLGFNKPVGVNFISDPENAKDPLGKTAYYDPNKMEITIFVDKRHVKDILRSLSHELVHHSQNCRGEFDQGIETGKGYAQKDPHMRKMEAEAYLLGNGFLFRDWEDHLKEKKQMSNFNEIKLRKYVNNLVRTVLKEDQDPGGTGPDMPKDPDAEPGPGDKEGEIDLFGGKKGTAFEKEKTKKKAKPKKGDFFGENMTEGEEEDDEDEEGELKEQGKIIDPKTGKETKISKAGKASGQVKKQLKNKAGVGDEGPPRTSAVGESVDWLKGNKNQLLFEELVKKWTK